MYEQKKLIASSYSHPKNLTYDMMKFICQKRLIFYFSNGSGRWKTLNRSWYNNKILCNTFDSNNLLWRRLSIHFLHFGNKCEFVRSPFKVLVRLREAYLDIIKTYKNDKTYWFLLFIKLFHKTKYFVVQGCFLYRSIGKNAKHEKLNSTFKIAEYLIFQPRISRFSCQILLLGTLLDEVLLWKKKMFSCIEIHQIHHDNNQHSDKKDKSRKLAVSVAYPS